MARTQAGDVLTRQHRQAQVRLGALTAARIVELFRLLDPRELTDTSGAWIDASIRLIASQHAVSTQLAQRYYRAFRIAEVGARFTGTLPTPALSTEAVRTSLIVQGPVRIERARRRGFDVEAAAQLARTEAARSAHRHALAGGRDTLTAASKADPRAGRWRRITSCNACDFCSTLAGRGAVYSERTADFEAHDGCSCTAEPDFT
jgi:hypothetical protein